MKKISLFFITIMLLMGCNDNSFNSGINNNSLNRTSSSLIGSNSKIELSKYSSHPYSEPEINNQLMTFNPLNGLEKVWDYYRGDKVLVAVIDSGFDYDHPEFIDKDGNSKVSEKSAFIYTRNNSQTFIEIGKAKVDITDGDSHGTMCAGLLGASVNEFGITGIAPNVELMLIKIDKHALSMAEAFKYAADNGAKVISTSLGAYQSSNGASYGDIIYPAGFDLTTAFNENINYAYSKGVTIVAAAGNSRTTTLSYPAGCENVIGAGGLEVGSQTLIWNDGGEGSNYNGSSIYVDVYAPSEGIYAPGYDTNKNVPTYWGNAKGTSFSAPLIAGAIALYFEKYPSHTNKDVEEALERSCVNISSYNNGKNMGLGRLDVSSLLNIEEDIKNIELNPSGTISKKATKLKIIDEEGWNLRTLHLYNLSFEKGYGYKEFERYLTNVYGERVKTSSYKLEGTTRCWAYTDENYVGDYYLCTGNTIDGAIASYEYIFPWWVKGAYYQLVNNSNWLPEGGNYFSASKGYGTHIESYFWWDSWSNFGVSQVEGSNIIEEVFNSLKVTKKFIYNNQIVKEEIETISIYDYYDVPNNQIYDDKNFIGWFIDEECTLPYMRSLMNEDTIIYGLFIA